ncbi:LMBR1-like membrane protein [Penicillium coprophilum]|uniref:LMBR1-like membrane protein n=1 Tax=Penicillium coprophilum TaxID=36646 RepID=UPI002387117C|nr:LMBR1-like membrane protein [Penicillium coprophilum]KAJ5173996.1 LMBR1-like membrane protein [Penicillium coprophilum]
MALLQTSLIWALYGVVIAILLAVASVFIYVYQTPRDRSPSVTLTCIISITSLLATVLLLPVDVALVSSTTSSKLGQRKDWATQDVVDRITYSLTIIYYFLYSLDALLCLLVIPFTYFWYEEYDEVATESGEQTVGQRIWGALKYTLSFVAVVVILFLVGFFVPVSQGKNDMDLDYFRRLLTENHGERALTFALGLLMTIGLCLYVLYTSVGLALLPISLIKTAPSISSATLQASTAQQLDTNQERQRQLEGRCAGDPELLSSKDRRELDTLVREERTLIRRQRLAEESQGGGRSWLMKAWYKIGAVLRPFKLLGGILLLLIAFLTWVSMFLTAIDKAMNSICKHRCGYILAHVNIFNPVNWALVKSARFFPIDYAIFTALVLLFFCSSVVGIAVVGIRFLWIRIFQIRNGHTSPQALLLATAMLMLIILALNYSISMVVAPQYATFGPQTFCDRAPGTFIGKLDCSNSKELIKPCSELAKNPAAQQVCTPSVVSTFLNRVTLNYPFFGVVFFWAQFVFIGLYLVVFVTSLFRSPQLDEAQLDEDAEEAEEEGLLANTGRRFNASWQDIIGRAARTERS